MPLKGNPKYYCKCDCGNSVIVLGNSLRKGVTTSCSCFSKEINRNRKLIHGNSLRVHYQRWRSMIGRCHDIDNISFCNYGAKGIKVCDRWMDFNLFLMDVAHTYEKGKQLDRINTFGNYELSNVRWVTPKENSNNKSNNRIYVFNGVSKNNTQWAAYFGVSPQALNHYVKKHGQDEAFIFYSKRIKNEI